MFASGQHDYVVVSVIVEIEQLVSRIRPDPIQITLSFERHQVFRVWWPFLHAKIGSMRSLEKVKTKM